MPTYKQTNFPESQYIKKSTVKKQIVLHHTASGPGTVGDVNWWMQTPEKVATCVLIERDGVVNQCFLSQFWAYHLGIKDARNLKLNSESIGIEIDSWGGLTEKNGLFYSYTGSLVPKENVIVYPKPIKGFTAYERYTTKQIEAVKELLLLWNDKYKIPLTYNADMWELSDRALNSTPGVWTHTSYRKDKSDCHPQPELIEMLKSLS